MSGVNSMATAVMVAVGSRYENRKNNGVSHFLEHMVFKGTKKYPTTDDVNIIERIGGLQNAYTDIDITNFHNKVLSTDWRLALEVNRELATAPLLLQKHVDRERDVIIEEMKRYEDEPAAKAEEVFHQMLYPGTALGMRTIGEEDSLRATGSKELKHYHDAWYKPNQFVVVLAGKMLHYQIPGITYQVEQWFGEFTGKVTKSFDKVIEEQKKPAVVVTTKPDASQAHFVLGLRTFARKSDARYAWSLFNLIMGVSFTSRLFREIREKRGLCYHIRSSSSNYADVGNWSIYAGVATDKVKEAIKATLHELGKVAGRGVTEEEVAVAKKRLKTILAFKSEDPEFLNDFYGRQEVYGEPIETLEEYAKRMEAVTKADIDTLAKNFLTQHTLNLSLVWNRGHEAGLETLLAF